MYQHFLAQCLEVSLLLALHNCVVGDWELIKSNVLISSQIDLLGYHQVLPFIQFVQLIVLNMHVFITKSTTYGMHDPRQPYTIQRKLGFSFIQNLVKLFSWRWHNCSLLLGLLSTFVLMIVVSLVTNGGCSGEFQRKLPVCYTVN